MNRSIRAGAAGLLLSLAVAGTASAVDVTVRAEGPTAPTVRAITVSPKAGTVTKAGKSCDANSGAGALELATAGDWTGGYFDGLGLTVDRIKGDNYPFSTGKYWSFDINGKSSDTGICGYTPKQGDELLFYVACDSATTGCFTGTPLDVAAPATVKPGGSFTVTVAQTDEFTGARTAVGGATVASGSFTATTGADGKATLTLTAGGPATITASKGTQVRDEVDTCVSNGADGFCGYAIPVQTAGQGGTVTPAIAPDTTAPDAAITGLRAKYKSGKGPRTLTASASDAASGLADVKLSLRRKVGKKCSAFGNTRGAFRRVGCKRKLLFSVGGAGDVSFLLPERLKQGSYTFEVIAIDRNGNRSAQTKTFTVK